MSQLWTLPWDPAVWLSSNLSMDKDFWSNPSTSQEITQSKITFNLIWLLIITFSKFMLLMLLIGYQNKCHWVLPTLFPWTIIQLLPMSSMQVEKYFSMKPILVQFMDWTLISLWSISITPPWDSNYPPALQPSIWKPDLMELH